MSKMKDKRSGVLKGLSEDKEEEKQKEKSFMDDDLKEDIEELREEVESEKINRSYMLSKSVLSKLQEIKIKKPDKNFSEIVENAIKFYYRNIKL